MPLNFCRWTKTEYWTAGDIALLLNWLVKKKMKKESNETTHTEKCIAKLYSFSFVLVVESHIIFVVVFLLYTHIAYSVSIWFSFSSKTI